MEHAQRRLTLTFDNGPDPGGTQRVLGELNKRNLPAIFFPVGERLESKEARDLAGMTAAMGHKVGNHTYSHPRPFGAMSDEDAIEEVKRTDALLGELREPNRYFRPSAGGGVLKPAVLNRGVVDHLVANRHTVVFWNVICEDWCRPDGSWIDLALVEMDKNDWPLIVLHDIASGAMDHLPAFLDALAERNIDIVPDLPAAQVPIINGEIVISIDHLVQ